MKINNNVEFKLSKDLVEYDSAIEFMNSHINKMKKITSKVQKMKRMCTLEGEQGRQWSV